MDFRHRAVCRDLDPELFFPVGDSGPAQVQTAAAKTVCAGCPVRVDCLTWAHDNLSHGIAGGLTADERARARATAHAARVKTPA